MIHSIFQDWYFQFAHYIGLADGVVYPFVFVLFLVTIIVMSLIGFFLGKYILTTVVTRVSIYTVNQWDDALVNRKFFYYIAYLIPAIICSVMSPRLLADYPVSLNIVSRIIHVYILAVVIISINAFLNAVNDIYLSYDISKIKPIKGYIQIIKIVIFSVGIIIILAMMMGKEYGAFLTGIGAATAVILFVFKDPILGFIGSIQLAANDMVRPNDWIEMPSHNADGDVIDMNLTTVKVQNWDKTITTIPTYALVSESFVNWRGMVDSGGRRIKRSIKIDMKSVKFCTPEMIDRFSNIQIIERYIKEKEAELQNFNKRKGVEDHLMPMNSRRQTNLGVFRKYLLEYLKNNPDINQAMTIQVRQLAPDAQGIPMEVYCFTASTAWIEFEMAQSDIFDHILSVIHEFDLRVFQEPTGDDIKALGSILDQQDCELRK